MFLRASSSSGWWSFILAWQWDGFELSSQSSFLVFLIFSIAYCQTQPSSWQPPWLIMAFNLWILMDDKTLVCSTMSISVPGCSYNIFYETQPSSWQPPWLIMAFNLWRLMDDKTLVCSTMSIPVPGCSYNIFYETQPSSWQPPWLIMAFNLWRLADNKTLLCSVVDIAVPSWSNI